METPFCAFLSGGITGLNDATTACVSTQFLCTRFLFHRNLKCLGSTRPLLSHTVAYRFLLLLPEGRSVLIEDGCPWKEERASHSSLSWDPASGPSLLHEHEEWLRTQTCTGSGKEKTAVKPASSPTNSPSHPHTVIC